jgi:hypothetical protein
MTAPGRGSSLAVAHTVAISTVAAVAGVARISLPTPHGPVLRPVLARGVPSAVIEAGTTLPVVGLFLHPKRLLTDHVHDTARDARGRLAVALVETRSIAAAGVTRVLPLPTPGEVPALRVVFAGGVAATVVEAGSTLPVIGVLLPPCPSSECCFLRKAWKRIPLKNSRQGPNSLTDWDVTAIEFRSVSVTVEWDEFSARAEAGAARAVSAVMRAIRFMVFSP